jgi:hypothetical protein
MFKYLFLFLTLSSCADAKTIPNDECSKYNLVNDLGLFVNLDISYSPVIQGNHSVVEYDNLILPKVVSEWLKNKKIKLVKKNRALVSFSLNELFERFTEFNSLGLSQEQFKEAFNSLTGLTKVTSFQLEKKSYRHSFRESCNDSIKVFMQTFKRTPLETVYLYETKSKIIKVIEAASGHMYIEVSYSANDVLNELVFIIDREEIKVDEPYPI